MVDALGYYTILEQIGAGALGEVYRARDTRLGRTVAVKLVPPEIALDPRQRERLLTAARIAAALSHPNIASLYEIAEDGDRLFLVFEYAPGETLRSTMAGRPMNLRRALVIAAEVADALADGHAAGIVHQDIRPGNIVITPAGRAKVLDFGLASFTGGGLARVRASRGSSADDTPATVAAYLSPEQALGAGTDHRADIFSLGSVLYEMLTGQSPFWAPEGSAIALRVVQFTPPRPGTVNRDVPAELDEIVRRALAKSLDGRFESAAALGAELRGVAEMLEADDAPRRARSGTREVRLRRSRSKSVGLALAVILAATAAWFGRAAFADRWRRTFGAPPPPILVVTPFHVSPGSAALSYLGEGVAEELASRLAQIDGLHVRGQSAPHRAGSLDPRALARFTGAAVALTGAVETNDDRVGLNLQLIDASDGAVIWSARYTRPAATLFALETEAAEQIAGRFNVRLEPTAERARTASRTIDRGAYDLYLQARQASARQDRTRALTLYEQAVEQDPGLAEANAGLAAALYVDALDHGTLGDAGVLDAIQRAAASAAAVDAELPQTQLALGLAAPSLVPALAAFRRAIDIAPSLSEGYTRAGQAIASLDPSRAAMMFETALRLDPFADARVGLATVYARLQKFDRASAEIGRLRQSDRGSAGWMLAQAAVDLRQGQPERALDRMATSAAEIPLSFLVFAYAAHLAGRVDRALEISSAIAVRYPAPCAPHILVAGLTADRGDRLTAHRTLDRWIGGAGPVATTGEAAVCAALASAAMGDGENAAAWLRRITTDEATLDIWLREGATESGRVAFDSRWYPWDMVADHPAVRAARVDLERAYARRLVQIDALLAALPEP